MRVFNSAKKSSALVSPPKNFEELISYLDAICGKNLFELSQRVGLSLPASTRQGKGFAGELIELCTGASAGNASIPDFPNLWLELKTIPVDEKLIPLESTFISYAPLTNIRCLSFEKSSLYSKISRVLFVIVLAPRNLKIAERKILGYFFWQPSEEELKNIKDDFNELMEMVKTGNIERVTAKIGTVIQMRPKCANGKQTTDCIGPDGIFIKTRPRGFYMRRCFTQKLLERYWNNKMD